MSKARKRAHYEQLRSNMILEAEEILDRLELGSWIPNVDICETRESIAVRVELPGIKPADIRLTITGRVLRIQGTKREPAKARERLAYYCLERRYGKFDRQIGIDQAIDARRTRATLVNGVLSIEMPRIEDRRGEVVAIAIVRTPE
jgi:HSP20 family protein